MESSTSSASRAHGNLNERAESKAPVFGREEGPRWTGLGHNPSPPTFGIRSHSYDVTSTILPPRISRPLFLALPLHSLLSRFSFFPSLSLSRSRFLSSPSPLSLSLSCSFPSFLLSSCSLLCFSVSFPPGSPLPFLRVAAARVISSRSLFSLLVGRSLCFSLKSYLPARRCTLDRQIAVRLYPRNRHRGFMPLRAFDRTPDSTAMMRENHKRLLLFRCMISVLMAIKPFSFARWKDTDFLVQSNIYFT